MTNPPDYTTEDHERDAWRALLHKVKDFIENSSLDEDEMEQMMEDVLPEDE